MQVLYQSITKLILKTHKYKSIQFLASFDHTHKISFPQILCNCLYPFSFCLISFVYSRIIILFRKKLLFLLYCSTPQNTTYQNTEKVLYTFPYPKNSIFLKFLHIQLFSFKLLVLMYVLIINFIYQYHCQMVSQKWENRAIPLAISNIKLFILINTI